LRAHLSFFREEFLCSRETARFLLADGQILPTSRRQEVSANGTLVLHRVDSSTDRGAYTCTAKNKQGRSDSQTIHIEVKGKIDRFCTYALSLSLSLSFSLFSFSFYFFPCIKDQRFNLD